MSKIIIGSHKEFEEYLGKEIGVSDYLQITQEQINKFADATLDHQWIHIDPERAKDDSPFGTTIAHGYLAVSVAPYLWRQIAEIHNLKMMINYGIEKLKFNQPVTVNSEVRLRAKLHSLVDLRGVSKAQLQVTLEIKDNPKPAFTALIVFLYHFEK
ncbi:MAG: MaoC family dehydratase [Fulvivirga sp.]|nr:MaoC family dehydratase [Fulvivirga sp.]